MQNPLLPNKKLIDFNLVKSEHIEPALDTILADNRQQITQLLQQSNFTWENLIQPLDDLSDRLTFTWNAITHLHSVINSPELRAAYEKCLPKITAYYTELSHNPTLFRAIESLSQKDPFQRLDPIQQKIIKDELRDFHLAGVDLPEAEKEQLAELQQRLSELMNRFEQNLLDATQAWTKLITDSKELAGLPERVKQSLAESAQEKNQTGWLITLEQPTYIAIMTYADSRDLRQEVYTANTTRASEVGPNAEKFDNTPIINEILAVRHEIAKLLGFVTYADLSLATKTAKSPAEVMDFLSQLSERALPIARKEFVELKEFAQQQHQINDVQAWDVAYLSEKLQTQKFNFSEEMLRPYFPIDQVLHGFFAVLQHLFGITVEEQTGVSVWHPEVRFFNVFDTNHIMIGHFYLDLYARSSKRGGAWMEEARSHRRLDNGTMQLPIAFVTCNFAKAVGAQPALLTHDEVETLFHEFGHAFHLLLTEVPYLHAAGINGVPWDVVEFPSQFLENWCWEKAGLDLVAKHYQTGASFPPEILQQLKVRKYFQAGMQTMRQLEFSLYDFRLHLEYDPARRDQYLAILKEIRQQFALYSVPEFNRFPHSFSHIFAGAYGAGYYSYKWAEVWSCDAYAKFLEDGIFNRATGEAYRQNILAKGSSADAIELFKAFRGRAPTLDALLAQLNHHPEMTQIQ